MVIKEYLSLKEISFKLWNSNNNKKMNLSQVLEIYKKKNKYLSQKSLKNMTIYIKTYGYELIYLSVDKIDKRVLDNTIALMGTLISNYEKKKFRAYVNILLNYAKNL